jgi:hypothetical protein
MAQAPIVWQTDVRNPLKSKAKATSENPCVGGSTPPLGTKYFNGLDREIGIIPDLVCHRLPNRLPSLF